MIIVVSPAKSLDFETPLPVSDYSTANFLTDSSELVDVLKSYSPQALSALMGISDKLAGLNAARFGEWSLPFTEENARQALLAFKGDVYTGLDAYSFKKSDFNFAQKHLRILSGLYGLLRPLDLIQPYRLEMGTKLENPRGRNLYAFWGDIITDALNDTLQQQKNGVLVNLASNEYFKSVNKKHLNAPIITPVFKDEKNGKYKIISFLAKRARGLMAGYIIRNRLKNVEDLKQFDCEGYQFNRAESSDSEWVFMRPESARG